MRPILPLIVLSALASVPAGAQSIGPPSIGPAAGPNAQAAKRPLGPKAQIAQRAKGPNAALARTDGLAGGQVHYPSCSAAGAARPTPVRRGEPGYGRHLDSDGDGIACK